MPGRGNACYILLCVRLIDTRLVPLRYLAVTFFLQSELEIMFDNTNEPSSEVEFHSYVDPMIVRVISLYIMFLFTWQRLFRISDMGIGVLFLFFAT